MTPARQRGERFLHRRVRDAETGRPMEYQVTRVARGYVYYRPVSGGHSECCPVEDFSRVVLCTESDSPYS